ncbi:MAG: YCF48-related protein [Gemmatimonadales bacterium]
MSAARRDAAGAPLRLRNAALVVALLGLATCQSHDAIAPGPVPVASISLTTSAVVIAPLERLTVTAVPRDSAGRELTGRTVTWTSSQPSLAAVDSDGVVTGVAGGMTTVTAIIGGQSASVTIYVSFPPPPPAPPPPPPPPQPPPTSVDTVGLLGPWTLVLNRPITSKYEGMSFPDAKHGWVVSDQGDILATKDSGVTWTQQASGLGPLRNVDFIDSTRGFAGTVGGSATMPSAKFYRTTDGGATWTDITSSVSAAPIGFCGITHFGNHVYVVGRYFQATDYYTSDDGGVTWRYRSLSGLMAGLVDVVFVDQSTGFIGGTGPSSSLEGPATILKTTDGGLSWRTVFNAAGPGWAWKIFPVTASVIYASIESDDGTYRVVKSVDGGETWAIQIVATGQRPLPGWPPGLQGIGFLDINVGWVGGFFTGMFATTNGGLTWSPVPVASAIINRYRRVGNTLFTAGSQGILRYDAPP